VELPARQLLRFGLTHPTAFSHVCHVCRVVCETEFFLIPTLCLVCCTGVCGHYLLLMSEKVTRIGCGNLNSGCSRATATIVCNMVLLSGFSFTTRPFPRTLPSHTHFSVCVCSYCELQRCQ
jgi:hypothetical protein